MQIEAIFTIAIIIYSAIAHEVAHGYGALMFGDITAKAAGRLSLNPIKHIDPVGSILLPLLLVVSHSPFLIGYAKPVPYNPYNLSPRRAGEIVVAAAGILTNFFIAIIFAVFVVRFGADLLPASFVEISVIVVHINVMLAIFNLLPVPGFDGAKLFKSILPFRLAYIYDRFENFFLRYGMVGSILAIFLLLFIIAPILGNATFSISSLLTGLSPDLMIGILSKFF